jgi:DNA-binding NarL/FixJ family response regulator
MGRAAEWPVKVLIVEDHLALAEALATSLLAHGIADVHVVNARRTSDEHILEIAARNRPSVVLLDLHFGGSRSGASLAEPLGRLGAAVLVVTAGGDPFLLAEAVRGGAVGVVDKAEPFDVLLDAIHRAGRGASLLTARERAEVVARGGDGRGPGTAATERLARLSRTERTVLRRLVAGRSPRAIAAERGVSLTTVRNQVQAVRTKLDVRTEREAVALAVRAGWAADMPDFDHL